MRAAVLQQLGTTPIYKEDYTVPTLDSSSSSDKILINMKAAAVKNLDKSRASGKHYSSYSQLPVVVGMDGVGVLQDGRRVYALAEGALGEQALADKKRVVLLPDEIDDITAAALPNAVMGAHMALLDRGMMKQGATVLINGATGTTGQMAVQLAKYYGASKVIATGRNPSSLSKLKEEYGADEIISLLENQENELVEKIKAIHQLTPIDIVIDYLWGHPIELILSALKGASLHSSTHKVRVVTVGSMAGENIQLPSGILRSSAIEICGSGFGSFSSEALKDFKDQVLPEMFKLAGAGKIKIETEVADLKDIESVWNKEVQSGKRLVIRI